MKIKLKDVIKESWLNDKVKSDRPTLTTEQKAEILGKIAEYNRYSKAIYNENDLIQIANELSEMAENAELLTLSETEDQFDKITVTRNMKELKNLSGQFAKSATEAQAFKQRLTGLYEDMGAILNRYFDIQEISEAIEDDAFDELGADKKIVGAQASLVDADADMSDSKARKVLNKYDDIKKI